jgi:single-stranded-DNA-specific exonuclease
VKQGNSGGFAAIGFGLGKKLEVASGKKPLDIAYCLDENVWNGVVSTQLRIKDIRIAANE